MSATEHHRSRVAANGFSRRALAGLAGVVATIECAVPTLHWPERYRQRSRSTAKKTVQPATPRPVLDGAFAFLLQKEVKRHVRESPAR